MAKISFNKFELVKNEDFNEIEIKGNKVQILKYLNIASKSSLVNAAVRGAVIDGIVDEILLDAYLHLFIVDQYTNIMLTPKQRENLLDTFDIMESNGFFDLIITGMEPNEYEYIFTMAKKLMNNLNEYNKNIVSTLKDTDKIIEKLVGQTK